MGVVLDLCVTIDSHFIITAVQCSPYTNIKALDNKILSYGIFHWVCNISNQLELCSEIHYRLNSILTSSQAINL